MDYNLILKISAALLLSLFVYILIHTITISTVAPTPTTTTTAILTPDRKYEQFNGRCLTASGSTPDNYTKINETLSNCNKLCETNENCQAYSYIPANSFNNNLSLCTIYSDTTTNILDLPGYAYFVGQDPGRPITKGNGETHYTCYHRI